MALRARSSARGSLCYASHELVPRVAQTPACRRSGDELAAKESRPYSKNSGEHAEVNAELEAANASKPSSLTQHSHEPSHIQSPFVQYIVAKM